MKIHPQGSGQVGDDDLKRVIDEIQRYVLIVGCLILLGNQKIVIEFCWGTGPSQSTPSNFSTSVPVSLGRE